MRDRLCMRFFSTLVAVSLVVTACSSGGDENSDPSPDTIGAETAVAPDDAPASTGVDVSTSTIAAPEVTSTTEPPPPEPITRQRFVVTGEETLVWDWTTDRCEDANIPDSAARAFRNADGEVNLTISHWDTYPMVGPSLDDLDTDCSRLLLSSDYDPDPAAFNDSEWISSVYTGDGETVYAVIHNEYRGNTHSAARPDQCPSGDFLNCIDTSLAMAVSIDGGRTFDHLAEPPGHLVATLPYTYLDDTVPSGVRQPSNIVEGPDDFYYLFANVSDQPDQEQWVCAMRTPDLDRPDAWRYWTGTDFTGVWKNPYVEAVTADDKCAPLEFGALTGSVHESIVYDESIERYVAVGLSYGQFGTEPDWGVYTATSVDLIDWTVRELLIELPINASVADSLNDSFYAYPAIIDPDSESLSFGTTDGQMYLYATRFNEGGDSLDRDLVRWPIAIEEYEPVAPDWTFDDESDLFDTAGGWTAEADLEPLVVADGALQFQTTGADPSFRTGAVSIPSEFDQLTIRMELPEGLSNAVELFWVTGDDPDFDEEKYTSFQADGTGEFTNIVVDLSSSSQWTGTIRSIRIDPVTAGEPVAGAIDRIWFERPG